MALENLPHIDIGMSDTLVIPPGCRMEIDPEIHARLEALDRDVPFT